MIEYVLWDRLGIVILGIVILGILLFFIILFLQRGFFEKAIGFFRQKSDKRSDESSDKEDAKMSLDFDCDGHLQTSENIADDITYRSLDLKDLLQPLIDEIRGIRENLERDKIRGIRENLNQIADILQSQAVSLNEIRGIRENLDQITDMLQNQISSLSSDEDEEVSTPLPDVPEPPQYLESETSEQIPQILKEFCELYNAGDRRQLQERYQLCCQISVANALERRQNADVPPRFERSSNGKFLAYYIQTEDLYVVVPAHHVVLERSSYGPGAFGEVFKCPGFNDLYRYKTQVIQPAYFTPDYTKERWEFKKKGKLTLEVIQ